MGYENPKATLVLSGFRTYKLKLQIHFILNMYIIYSLLVLSYSIIICYKNNEYIIGNLYYSIPAIFLTQHYYHSVHVTQIYTI